MSRRKWIPTFFGLLVLPLVLAGWASAATPTPASTKAAAAPASPTLAPVTIRYGTLGFSSEAGVFIAADRGYFQKQGIKVELVNFSSGAQMIAPLSTGELHAGTSAINAGLFNAIARGVDIKIVAGIYHVRDGERTATAVLARKDLVDGGQLKGFGDLKGKKVAIVGKGIHAEIYVARMLEKGGLRFPGDVELTTLGGPNMMAAFTNKALDLAFIGEPFITQWVERGLVVRWKELYEIYPGNQPAVILFSPDFATKKPDAANRFMVAYLQGVRDAYDVFNKAKGSKEEVIASLIKNTSVKDRALYDKMSVIQYNANGELMVDDFRYQQDWYADHGYVERKADMGAVVDRRFLDQAIKQLGEYR